MTCTPKLFPPQIPPHNSIFGATQCQLTESPEETQRQQQYPKGTQQPFAMQPRQCYACSGLRHVARNCRARKQTTAPTASATNVSTEASATSASTETASQTTVTMESEQPSLRMAVMCIDSGIDSVRTTAHLLAIFSSFEKEFLLDTGSEISVIPTRMAAHMTPKPFQRRLFAANGTHTYIGTCLHADNG